MDILHFGDCLAHKVKNHRSGILTPKSEHLFKDETTVHGIMNEQGHSLDVKYDI